MLVVGLRGAKVGGVEKAAGGRVSSLHGVRDRSACRAERHALLQHDWNPSESNILRQRRFSQYWNISQA